jgi:hypothetical protein
LIVLGLLAEVKDTPLRIELDVREGRQQRDVYLRDPAPRSHAEQASVPDLSGRVVAVRPVIGHMKRVWIGPGRSKCEFRYIAGHSARRWLGPRWVVSRREDGGA